MSLLDKLDDLTRRVAAILVGATLLLGGSSMVVESAGAERRWGVLAVAAAFAFLWLGVRASRKRDGRRRRRMGS